MTIDELKNTGYIIFDVIAGSYAYGTNLPESDKDQRGIFIYPNKMYARLEELEEQISDTKSDISYFSLKKFFQLIVTANPNLIELLWTPEDCVLLKSKESDLLLRNRDTFISKKAFFSHASYAFSQIKKASGKNKKVHGKERYFSNVGLDRLRAYLDSNLISPEWIEHRFSNNFLKSLLKGRPVPITTETSFKKMDEVLLDEDVKSLLPPRHIDFCYFVKSSTEGFPMRPVPLSQIGMDLREYNCSSMEHVGNVFRLYYYGDKANGVFKGGEVVCSSIPIEDESTKFSGLLIYAHNEYESAKKDWRSYWDWMSERNENRWKSSDSEATFEYDRKNMQHTVRLLLSGENIAKEGVPLVRFSGDKLKFLREIREGKYAYDYLMKFANDKVHELHSLFESSSLPDGCNTKKVAELYDEIINMNGVRDACRE